MSNVTSNGTGVVSMVFDSKGDLFYATNNSAQYQGGTSPNTIFECTAACLYSGSPVPVILFQDTVSSTPKTTGQLEIGGLAIDATGNLFFSDSAVYLDPTSGTNNQQSFSSNVNELPVSSTLSTGYASGPTVIYAFVPSSPGSTEIDGVAVDKNDTVYVTIQNSGGIIAFPSSSGTYNASSQYTVSTISGKLLAMDANGNFYAETYVSSLSADGMYYIASNGLTAATAAVGASSTTPFTTILNDSACGSGPMVTFAATGTNPAAFAAATTGTCASTQSGGASFATSISFTPTLTGINTATLTATDSSSNRAAATVTANATGTLATPTFSPAAGTYTSVQSVAITGASVGAPIYYTTDGSTPSASSTLYTGPITLSASKTLNAIAIEAGDTSSSVVTAAYTLNIPPTATPAFSVAGGIFTSAQSVTLSDSTSGAAIYYTTDGSTPSASSTLYTGPIVVSASEKINAIAASLGAANSAVTTATFTISVPASTFQNVVLSQSTQLGTYPTGGAQSGGEPAGTTIVVNAAGSLITTDTYGNQILSFPAQAGTPTVLGTISNPNGLAEDSYGNLYLGLSYASTVVKIPFVNGAYAALAATVTGTPNCTGNDTVECIMSNLTTGGGGVISMVFDSQGDLFYGTTNNNQYGPTPNAIFECTAACLYTGSPAPNMVFQEPTAASPDKTGQLSLGGLALDASGDLFFTDSAIGATNNQESFSSNLNELKLTSGTYVSKPAVIYTYTPATPANYDSEVDGVAVGANGTVYALVQGTGGILAFPKVSGAYSNSNMYLVSTQTGKLMTSDVFGNLYVVSENNTVFEIGVDNLAITKGQVGAAPSTTTNVTTILNDGSCSSSPTVSFTSSGTNSSAFSASTTGTCAAAGITSASAAFATTVSFAPSTTGTNVGTLTAKDSAGNSGSAEVTAAAAVQTAVSAPTFTPAAGKYTSVQSVAISDSTTPAPSIYYTTDGSTPTTSSTLYSGPISVGTSETISAIAVSPGLTNSQVATAIYSITLPAASPTFSPAAGAYTSIQTVTIADTTKGAAIYYTTDGSTPTASSLLYSAPLTVSSSETINAIAIATGYNNSPVASAAYAITLPPAAAPTFSVSVGTYTTVQSVALSDATAKATIYFTMDGTTPTINSTLYKSPISVSTSEVINAIAVAPGYSVSPIGTALYTINLPSPTFALTSPTGTIVVPAGGSGTATISVQTNATFSGQMALTCSGFLPVGYTCTLSPATLTPTAGGTASSTVTITAPKAAASIDRADAPRTLLAGLLLAGVLSLLELRKGRRLQMLLMIAVGLFGFTLLSGCGSTTSSTGNNSAQIIVTATAAQPSPAPPIVQMIGFAVQLK
jgi:hypothetical protein